MTLTDYLINFWLSDFPTQYFIYKGILVLLAIGIIVTVFNKEHRNSIWGLLIILCILTTCEYKSEKRFLEKEYASVVTPIFNFCSTIGFNSVDENQVGINLNRSFSYGEIKHVLEKKQLSEEILNCFKDKDIRKNILTNSPLVDFNNKLLSKYFNEAFEGGKKFGITKESVNISENIKEVHLITGALQTYEDSIYDYYGDTIGYEIYVRAHKPVYYDLNVMDVFDDNCWTGIKGFSIMYENNNDFQCDNKNKQWHRTDLIKYIENKISLDDNYYSFSKSLDNICGLIFSFPRCLVNLTVIEYNDGNMRLSGIEFVEFIYEKQISLDKKFIEHERMKEYLKVENAIIEYNALINNLPLPNYFNEIIFSN
ncbi:hypothetical protein OAJ23_02355 [Pelagibacteraceae bacterium]|nr:hypothetical protein [Pelagibacteraceae bacterium]